MRLSSLWGMMSRHQIWYSKLSASQSSSTASGNADILHRLMKIYCNGRCSTTALKKAIGCVAQRMLVCWPTQRHALGYAPWWKIRGNMIGKKKPAYLAR